MTLSKNTNPPVKGSRITVDLIRRVKDINAIKQVLSDQPRNLLLFVMGVNNGLRVGDLLQLSVGDVRYFKIGETTMIKESKTGKINVLMIDKTVHKAIKNFLASEHPDDGDFLFAS